MLFTRTLAFTCFGLTGVVFFVFGVIYLTRRQFLPYHAVAVGKPWQALDARVRVLLLAALRLGGAGLIVTGIAVLSLLIVAFRAKEPWAAHVIAVIGLTMSAATLWATLHVKRNTPAKPPVLAAAVGLGLVTSGWVLALI